jgi:hypothetical protein
MIDPLDDFDWDSLYSQYDGKCLKSSRFNHNASALKCFAPSPKTDRDLYYSLISRISSEREVGSLMTLQSYTAIVYWKMYSTSPKTNSDIDKDISLQEQLRKRLISFDKYPAVIKKERNLISELVQRTLNLNLYGMRLPVCTTVLHYLYPGIVPIFDQMILRAVWYDREEIKLKRLNQSQELYNEYLEHHWSMVEKYADKITNFRETPVRAIEMALWVSRGDR